MKVNPYLLFNGQCAAAFRFYEDVLGGKTNMVRFGDTPMKDNVPPDWKDKVIHAELETGSFTLMGSDAPPPHYAAPQGMSVAINVESIADARRIFSVLSSDGKVTMPFQMTFWSPGFGMAVDRFGIPWMVGCHQAD